MFWNVNSLLHCCRHIPFKFLKCHSLVRTFQQATKLWFIYHRFSPPPHFVVQSPSCVWLFVTPRTAAAQASLSFTISWSLQNMFVELVMPFNHLVLCHSLLLLPSIFPSIRCFSSELALCIRWPKYWSFSLSISPSNEYLGLTSFRIDLLDLLAVQGTLKSLLQHHSSKASVLRCSTFL